MSNGHVMVRCVLYMHINEASLNKHLPRLLTRRQQVVLDRRARAAVDGIYLRPAQVVQDKQAPPDASTRASSRRKARARNWAVSLYGWSLSWVLLGCFCSQGIVRSRPERRIWLSGASRAAEVGPCSSTTLYRGTTSSWVCRKLPLPLHQRPVAIGHEALGL